MKISFQGTHGAYSQMAIRTMYGAAVESVPRHSFDDVFEGVQSGADDRGLVPIENTLAGSIHRNYDLLLRHDLLVVGETKLRIEHCLIGLPGVAIEEIRTVRSHPQALAQCERYLAELGVAIEAAYDTAGSVEDLKASGDRASGAVASALAAELYEMDVLAQGIEDDKGNFTRFLLLSKEAAEVAGPVKTSIVFALKNEPAALFRAMACFALRDIDLTKIESRPLPGSPWQYRFYLDYVGGQDGTGQKALEHLAEMATELRVLGTYPMAE